MIQLINKNILLSFFLIFFIFNILKFFTENLVGLCSLIYLNLSNIMNILGYIIIST